ncbi:uncharacterized protein BXIN_1072 [Babesia sp. Xinjiang]|uniref:uncharacterized protein n=1 Tax=Babesia sp. Xinjiang TaxID=462227 RepID=UPI000A2259AC|nr:uncharacterized protein BXIN_1072 [Babesia sp. Xinjiang]ORM41975.1 hypothetical protein BXIN_1072 [Babesia sp. Xinjiang]
MPIVRLLLIVAWYALCDLFSGVWASVGFANISYTFCRRRTVLGFITASTFSLSTRDGIETVSGGLEGIYNAWNLTSGRSRRNHSTLATTHPDGNLSDKKPRPGRKGILSKRLSRNGSVDVKHNAGSMVPRRSQGRVSSVKLLRQRKQHSKVDISGGNSKVATVTNEQREPEMPLTAARLEAPVDTDAMSPRPKSLAAQQTVFNEESVTDGGFSLPLQSENETLYGRSLNIDSGPPYSSQDSVFATDSMGELVGKISNRRLHMIQSMFSEQQTGKVSDIVSTLHQLLGSVNTNLTHLYEIGDDTEERDQAKCVEEMSSSATHVDNSSDPEPSVVDFDCPIVSDQDSGDSAGGLEHQNPDSYDSLKWPFEMSSPNEGGTYADAHARTLVEQGEGSENDTESPKVRLTKRELARIRHTQMLAKHERLKLLRSTNNKKTTFAVFFPATRNPDVKAQTEYEASPPECQTECLSRELPSDASQSDLTEKPIIDTVDNMISTSGRGLNSVPSDDSAERLSRLQTDDFEEKGGITNIFSMLNPDILRAAGVSNYSSLLLPDDTTEAPPSEYDSRFESFVVSITKQPQNSGKGRTTKEKVAAANKSGHGTSSVASFDNLIGIRKSDGTHDSKVSLEETEVSDLDQPSLEIPVTMFTLRRGFLKTVYDKYLKPPLVSTLERVFQTKLTSPCGIMDFDSLDLESLSKPRLKELRIDRSALRNHLCNVVVRSRLEQGDSVIEYHGTSSALPKPIRQHVCQLFKWVKDDVFLSSWIKVLEELLGRTPSMSELAFTLGHDDPRQLEETIRVSRWHARRYFEAFALPIGKLILLKIESENQIKRKFRSGNLELIDPHMYNVEPISSEVLWHRISSIHLNTMSSQGDKVISQLYGVSCAAAKHEYLKAKLPDHLPFGKYRLACRARILHRELLLLRARIASEVRMSFQRGIPLPDDLYRDNPFAQRIMAIERAYIDVPEGSSDYAKRLTETKRVINEEMSARLEVPFEGILDALDSARIRESSGPKLVLNTDKPSRFRRRRGFVGGHLLDYDKYEDYLTPECQPLKPWSLEYKRDSVLRRSLRMVAVEALDDRIARFVFMAYLRLFINGSWTGPELAEALGLSGPKVMDLIFYAARAHCQAYEAWRIKLKLPPYVNEAIKCPDLVPHIELPDGRLPHHLATLGHSIRRDGRKSRPVRPAMKDRYKRMRTIKPRIGTMKDSLVNYRNNFASIQRVLESSPLYYLSEI